MNNTPTTTVAELRVKDAAYVTALDETNAAFTVQGVGKMVVANAETMIAWGEVFRTKVEEYFQRRAERVDESQGTFGLLDVLTTASAVTKFQRSIRGMIESVGEDGGFLVSDIRAVQDATEGIVDRYRASCRAKHEKTTARLICESEATSRRKFQKFHDKIVDSYAKEDEEHINAWQQATKTVDECLSLFIQVTDKRFADRLERDSATLSTAEFQENIRLRDERRAKLVKAKTEQRKEAFDNSYGKVVRGNARILATIRSICLTCSMKGGKIVSTADSECPH